MNNYGPNVTKLITRFAARETIPPGTGSKSFDNAIRFFQDPELRKKILEKAESDALKAIQLVKSAPDNPYGNDDEKIAGIILEKVSERLNKGGSHA